MRNKTLKNPFLLLLCFLVVLAVLSVPVNPADIQSPLDLSGYPDLFISNSRLDVMFVVGEFADSGDVLGLVELANSLQQVLAGYDNPNAFSLDIKGNLKDELTELYMDVFTKKKQQAAQTTLDTTLDLEKIKDKNLILIGGPCVNWVSAHFMGNPENCDQGFYEGRAHLRLFRNGKGIVLMVAGFTVDDTRMAAHILANYRDFSSNLHGETVAVSSAWIDKVTVK